MNEAAAFVMPGAAPLPLYLQAVCCFFGGLRIPSALVELDHRLINPVYPEVVEQGRMPLRSPPIRAHHELEASLNRRPCLTRRHCGQGLRSSNKTSGIR